MKKMLIATTIISIVLSIFLVALVVNGSLTGNDEQITSSKNEQYVVKDKLWGEPEILTSFITPNQTAIKLQAEQLKKNTDMETIIATYDWLESGYHYETDSLEVRNNGHTILKGGPDTWNPPVFTLAVKHQNDGNVWVDCEDGTYLLVSLLRANNINAWANIGTVEIDGSVYGHAWATVILNGQEFLLETTLGQPLQALKPVPSFYSPAFTFNEKDVRPRKFGASIDDELTPLPPAKIQDLKNLLNG
jgi:transglutaminase-like putative cysteine protease